MCPSLPPAPPAPRLPTREVSTALAGKKLIRQLISLQHLLQGKLHLTKGPTSSLSPGFYHQEKIQGIPRHRRVTGSPRRLTHLTPFYKNWRQMLSPSRTHLGGIFCWLLCVFQEVQFGAGCTESALALPWEIFCSLLGLVQHLFISVGNGVCFIERAESQSTEYVHFPNSS